MVPSGEETMELADSMPKLRLSNFSLTPVEVIEKFHVLSQQVLSQQIAL